MSIYLDNNATTRPTAEVAAAVAAALTEHWHNPSSIHRPGQSARYRVEQARKSVAALIGAKPRDVIFTAGGTESIDLAIRGSVLARRAAGGSSRPAIVTTEIEHNAVRELGHVLAAREGVDLRIVRLDGNGRVDLGHLESLVDGDVAVVSIQWANNETGHIQPIRQIGELCRARGVTYHCDGTQWVGKGPTNVGAEPIDLLTFSAHKLHGPKGIGVLYVRPGVRVDSVIHGEQEMGKRGGTENTPGIVGLGVAAEQARAWLENPANVAAAAAIRDRFEAAVLKACPGSRRNAPPEAGARLWNTASISFASLEAEAILFMLSERGVCASAGSACSSGSLEPSPVLRAMGTPPEVVASSVRFSICRHTTEDEVDRAAAVVTECIRTLREAMNGSARPAASQGSAQRSAAAQ